MESKPLISHEVAQQPHPEAGNLPVANGLGGIERAPTGPEAGKIRPQVPSPSSNDNSTTTLSNPLQPVSSDGSGIDYDQASLAADTPAISRPMEELKRWYIDKASKAISTNRGDPYTESQQLEAIKRSYLRDIYHRELKLTSE